MCLCPSCRMFTYSAVLELMLKEILDGGEKRSRGRERERRKKKKKKKKHVTPDPDFDSSASDGIIGNGLFFLHPAPIFIIIIALCPLCSV